jgi:hypothetical protein
LIKLAQAVPRALAPAARSPKPVLQRKSMCGSTGDKECECDECKKSSAAVQRFAADAPASRLAPPLVHEVLRSPGQPLDGGTRTHFERRLGHDFNRVRIHADTRAAESARAVNAMAYTVGPHIVFAHGQYAPATATGRKVIAHELTHVIQQRDVHLQSPHPLPVGAPDDAFEQEADLVAAERPIAGRPLRLQGASVQRLDIVTRTLRFFGISVGTITDDELTEYLDRVSANRKCDCGFFDFLSDDMAREVINRWGVGKYSLDQAYKGVPSTELKRILIQELLSGPTLGDDERAIITVFQRSSAAQILEILDPAWGLDIQQVLDNVSGDNQEELLAVLEKKLPDIASTHLKRTDRPSAEGGACTVAYSLKIHFAQQMAERLVGQTIDSLEQLAANPVENKNVQRVVDCYFKGATPAQVGGILQDFKLLAQTLPKLFFLCPADPFTGYTHEGKLLFEPEKGLAAKALVPKEEPKKESGGAGNKPASAPAPQAATLQVALFPDFFGDEPLVQARTVIHEALHHLRKHGDDAPEIPAECGVPPLQVAFENARSYSMFAAQLGQSGLHVTFEDCPEAWKLEMVAAARTAEIWLSDAIDKLNTTLASPQRADARMRWGLKAHFHTEPDNAKVVREIRDTLAEVQSAFGGELPLECETECAPDVAGYTGGFLGIFPRGGNIHLCRHWFEKLDHNERAETILHEMMHRYAGKGFNEVYRKASLHGYSVLTTEEALDNADSFAQFARTLPEPAGDPQPAAPVNTQPAAPAGKGATQ